MWVDQVGRIDSSVRAKWLLLCSVLKRCRPPKVGIEHITRREGQVIVCYGRVDSVIVFDSNDHCCGECIGIVACLSQINGESVIFRRYQLDISEVEED